VQNAAVYAFKLKRICRICVQSKEIVAKVQLADKELNPSGNPRLASIAAEESALADHSFTFADYSFFDNRLS